MIFILISFLQTLGNHDFDYGVKTLLGFLEEIKCPVVVSNMDTSKEPLWPDATQLVRTTVIVDVNGEKIGFVGYILPQTSRYKIIHTSIYAKISQLVNKMYSKQTCSESVNKL